MISLNASGDIRYVICPSTNEVTIMRVTGLPCAYSALFLVLGLGCIVLYLALKRKGAPGINWPLVGGGVACLGIAIAIFVQGSLASQNNFNNRQAASRDLTKLQLPATVLNYSVSNHTIKLQLGQSHCIQDFEFYPVSGQDPDGWHVRWRPWLAWSDGQQHYGLGQAEISQFNNFCDNRPRTNRRANA